MYTDNDFSNLGKQIRSVLIKIAIIFVIFLVVSLLVAKNISNPLGLIVLIIGLCICQFIWGIFGKPVVIYKNFIQEILTGRKRNRKSYIVDIGSKPVYKDNRLFYYEILTKEDEEDEMEQLFLFDSNRELPSLQTGRWYEFELYQNYITGVENMNGE